LIKSFQNESFEGISDVLLITGIANPFSLEKHLRSSFRIESMSFPDHHTFTLQDIQKIHKKFDTFANKNKAIVTTEKDYMRLIHSDLKIDLKNYPWFYQTITVQIDREINFNDKIKRYVGEF
jgi:tetraacyldisaccharide 4'-kinase